ncbi:hypothetical protein R3P38DRAFT_3225605 [Favolaschia claudopus]|uniref:Uncharacterized protein n=1 Tax=Favolaschia claudopus TaxID=2862362 RepID=A0AAV9ZUU4_9AGAR
MRKFAVINVAAIDQSTNDVSILFIFSPQEYDGGYAYFGPNSYNNLSKAVPWAQWLTDPDPTHARVERAVMPMQAYAWTLLNTSTPWSVKFDSSGAYARHLVRFSVSGLPEAADLRVELDGEDLGWTPRADIGLDRYHYDVHRDGGLSAGEHTLSFTLLNGAREPAAQMCSAEVLEFGDESEFVATPGHYSLYPTFSLDNQTPYRPTNEDCLMRQVTTPNFCKACIEGLWLALLRNVSLIDDIDASSVADLGESYTVTWRKDGQAIDKFTNSTEGEVGSGQYAIEVQYATNEVRVDRDDRLKA